MQIQPLNAMTTLLQANRNNLLWFFYGHGDAKRVKRIPWSRHTANCEGSRTTSGRRLLQLRQARARPVWRKPQQRPQVGNLQGPGIWDRAGTGPRPTRNPGPGPVDPDPGSGSAGSGFGPPRTVRDGKDPGRGSGIRFRATRNDVGNGPGRDLDPGPGLGTRIRDHPATWNEPGREKQRRQLQRAIETSANPYATVPCLH